MYIFVFVLSEVSHRLSLDQWSSGPVMCGGSIVKKMIAVGAFVKRVKENNKGVKEHGSICIFVKRVKENDKDVKEHGSICTFL